MLFVLDPTTPRQGSRQHTPEFGTLPFIFLNLAVVK